MNCTVQCLPQTHTKLGAWMGKRRGERSVQGGPSIGGPTSTRPGEGDQTPSLVEFG